MKSKNDVSSSQSPPPIKSSCDAETQLWLFDVSGLLVVYVKRKA